MSHPSPFDVYDHRGIVDPALVAEEQAATRAEPDKAASRRPWRRSRDSGNPGYRIDQSRLVSFAELDDPSRALAGRAREARNAVLNSLVFAEDLVDRITSESELRAQEWEIALDLRHITELRAQHDEMRERYAADVGPMTAEILDPQRRVLDRSVNSVIARISAMESYAGHVRAADAALLDWQRARELAGLNEKFIELAARTTSDGYGLSELESLSEQAAVAAQTLKDSIFQVNLAAQALAIPAEDRPVS